MIVYDIACSSGHRFEGWFGSSTDFDEQAETGLLACPQCGSPEVRKAPMAPAVARSEASTPPHNPSDVPIPPKVQAAMKALAKAQSAILSSSRYVGEGFAENARAMHYGEKEVEAIHGKATVDQARELLEEGVGIAPLPFPVADPDELN